MGGFVSAWLHKKGRFLSVLQSISETQPLWFNAYSLIESFLSLLPLWRGFLGWEKVLFLMIFPVIPCQLLANFTLIFK